MIQRPSKHLVLLLSCTTFLGALIADGSRAMETLYENGKEISRKEF
jgi:hypothetical protein